MTREEAIAELSVLHERLSNPKDCEDGCYSWDDGWYVEAIDMAIEALHREEAEEKGYCHRIFPKPTKAVSPSLADVYKWERDIALSQLEEYGIGFAEKKRDDLLEVVRCKDCRWCQNDYMGTWCGRFSGVRFTNADDFCSHGERREPNE